MTDELCTFCGFTLTDPRHIDQCKPIKYPEEILNYLENEAEGFTLVKALTGFSNPEMFCTKCGSIEIKVREKKN